jgi:membrane protease YdiL (CAAX protease family)
MIIADLLVAFAFALLMVWIFSLVFKTKGPWNKFIHFFLVVGLFAWAGGVWLVPFGPKWYGIGWMPILLMCFIAILMVTAATSRSPQGIVKKKRIIEESEGKAALDIFFWLLIIGLVLFGTSHYMWNPNIIR